MYSLYLDTSTKFLCIGISKDYKIIYDLQIEAMKQQSELTIPYLKEALEKTNLTLQDIQEVVITIGPGSFTGIRIGMCIGKVLASMAHIPLIAISSLNAYAGRGKKIVILDAKGNRVYVGIYVDNQKQMDECVMDMNDFLKLKAQYADFDVVLDSHLIQKNSEEIHVIENMCRIAKTMTPVENVDTLIPIYLKER